MTTVLHRPAGTPGAYATRLALIVVAALASARPAHADEPQPPAGMTVQFPPTLTADVAVRLREVVYVPLKRFQTYYQRQGQAPPHPFRLLCDFNPDGRADATGDFGPCWALAKEIRELQGQGVETRAFVHGDVSRHAVLPVLACAKIVMSSAPPARIGRVADSGPLPRPETDPYGDWLMAGAHFPPAVVRKMFDRDLVVVKVSPAGKVIYKYVDAKEAADNNPPLHADPVPGLGPAEIAFYDFAQAKEFGLLASQDPQNKLADALGDFGLPANSVYPLMDQTVAYRIKVEGVIDGRLKEDVDRRLGRALSEKANVLILDLECADGDDQTAYQLGKSIAGLKDRADRPIKTVAYVSSSAKNTAAFLALACDEIVMQKDAVLGDFESYLQEHPDRVADVRAELKDTAESGYYPPALAEGMADPDVRVVRADDGAILTEAEWKGGQKAHGANATDVKPAGVYLKLGAADAQKDGIVEKVVNDYNDFCTQENVKTDEVQGDWLNGLAWFLCLPVTSIVLVMIGVTCLIIELKMPGASLPGVIAAVCFVLFFWSQSQTHPEITWLAVLLFILGLLLIGVEVFIMPGTGVCGISGALLTVAGLALVAFGKWPETTNDWVGFGQKLGPYSGGIIASVVLAFVAVRYLKHIPFLNRLILKPPGEAADGETSAPEPLQPELASLLGAIGVAATPLRPAGKTQFGEQFVDVVAEGGYVRPGARVQVIEIEGNRIVVKEV